MESRFPSEDVSSLSKEFYNSSGNINKLRHKLRSQTQRLNQTDSRSDNGQKPDNITITPHNNTNFNTASSVSNTTNSIFSNLEYDNGNETNTLKSEPKSGNDEFLYSSKLGMRNYNRLNDNTVNLENESDLEFESNGSYIKTPNTLKTDILGKLHSSIKNEEVLDHDNLNSNNNNNNNNNIPTTINVDKAVEKNKNINVSRRRTSETLRKRLGHPLPLPYMDNNIQSTPLSSSIAWSGKLKKADSARIHKTSKVAHSNEILTIEKLEDKRRQMAAKWRELILKDKVSVEKKLRDLQNWDPIPNKSKFMATHNNFAEDMILSPITRKSSLSDNVSIIGDHELSSLGSRSVVSQQSLLKLQEDIEVNSQKLDLILNLLNGDDRKTVYNDHKRQSRSRLRSYLSSVISKEIIYWTICIIFLLVCNIYVYYYV